ncbi:plasmid maintenance system antidote protein [Pedobacter sp. SYP-B3415]|uniref:helix-turn-helix transcriptional regulator n=1 Tax=Pedobacter sp. SYP-B3415 TaxID=2496641 RepID=UPI00101C5164|nr:plasmid maintenance system antidote protein [Pedobacter sp. SYP-B3415]
MEETLKKFKGIHPGLILDRELKRRKIRKGPFALSLPEYPQTISAITKGKRSLTPEISLKIDRALGYEDGTMLVLQAYWAITQEKIRMEVRDHPELSVFRKALFWDTDITKLDWAAQYKAIIQRVFERGNEAEKEAILQYYGSDKIREVTGESELGGNRITVEKPGRKS